jgi:uncharacterized membrane protein
VFSTPTGRLLVFSFVSSEYSALYNFMNVRTVFGTSENAVVDSDSFTPYLGYQEAQYSVAYMTGLANGISVIGVITGLPKNTDLYLHMAVRAYCINYNSAQTLMYGTLDHMTVFAIPA